MGRKPAFPLRRLLADLEGYLHDADPPILTEYANLHHLTKQQLLEAATREPALAEALQKLNDAREIRLEKGGLNGSYKTTMVAFCLKEMGWGQKEHARDAEETEDEAGVILLPEVTEDEG